MLINQEELKVLSEALKTRESRFASFKYTNKHGETSRYLVHLNVNYQKLLKADLKIAMAFEPSNEIEEKAKKEIIDSLTESIQTGKNSRYTKEGYYEHLSPSVKCSDTNVYINGLVIDKKVLTPGTYPTVNSRPLTIAKNKIRKLMRHEKYREFVLDRSMHTVKINGKTIELD